MKKFMRQGIVFGVFTLSLNSVQTLLFSCGGSQDNLSSLQQTVNYLLIEGREFFAGAVDNVIQSLKQLHQENPKAFTDFIIRCLDSSATHLPLEILDVLKKYNLVQDDGTVSETVKFIISWVVEPKADGSVDVWSIQRLLLEGWIAAKN